MIFLKKSEIRGVYGLNSIPSQTCLCPHTIIHKYLRFFTTETTEGAEEEGEREREIALFA